MDDGAEPLTVVEIGAGLKPGVLSGEAKRVSVAGVAIRRLESVGKETRRVLG